MSNWDDFIQKYKITTSCKIKKINQERADRIRTSKASVRIIYPTFADAFDYVHAIYPKANVRQAQVYHASTELMRSVGYNKIGGLYDNVKKMVIVTDYIDSEDTAWGVKAEYTLDEVLVHELIHYASNAQYPMSDRLMEEEFAYGHSVNYLRRKRSDDFIIRKNMMPHLVALVDKESVIKKVFSVKYAGQDIYGISPKTLELMVKSEEFAIQKAIIEQAYKIGQRIVDTYGNNRKSNIVDVYKEPVRQLDLSDF